MTTTADLRLGPLTTTFTAPGACNSITVSTDTAASTAAPYIYPRYFSSIANSCFPSLYPLGSSAIAATFGAYGYHDEHVYFSPGICPSGWNQNIAGSFGTGNAAETTAFCCMPGFGPQTTPAVDGAWGYYSTYCTMKLGSATVTTVPYTGDGAADGGTRIFTFGGNTIPAGAVWIRYKAGDPGQGVATTGLGTTTSSTVSKTPASGTIATSVLTTVKTETLQVSSSPASSAPPSTATTVLVSVQTTTLQVSPSGASSTSPPSTTSSQRLSISSHQPSRSRSDSSSTIKASTSTSGTQTTSFATISTTSSPPSTPTSTPPHGLSTGSKIGIGVGAGLALLFALAILLFFLHRRKEKQPYPDMIGRPEVEAISGLRGGEEAAKELPAVTTGMRPVSELPAGDVSRGEMLFLRPELDAEQERGHGIGLGSG